ncbi:hypothetical protein [Nocardia niigatensis]|uniref:hypothetical protein n=1 Tax=Nocardia niigatensis TaxID=209249 RepID=UPI000304294B|nr:hypothetical protein [Nocardia niigatensis]
MISFSDIDPNERRLPTPSSYLVHRTVYLDRLAVDRINLGELRAFLAELTDWPDEAVIGGYNNHQLGLLTVTRREYIGDPGSAQ